MVVKKGKYEDVYGLEKAIKIKEKISINHANVSGKNNPMYNKLQSPSSKLKMSLKAKERLKDKTKHPMYGKPRPIETKEKIKKNHPNFKGNKHPQYGTHKTEQTKDKIRAGLRLYFELPETKQKLSKQNSGENNPFYGKQHTDIWVQNLTKRKATQIFPLKDTKPEVIIQNFLKKLNVEFFPHYYINNIEHKYQCDIFIPSKNLIIECDGNYWHNYPYGNPIDHIRTKELQTVGYRVIRLWESEILTNKDVYELPIK